jgi:hypothetical protein
MLDQSNNVTAFVATTAVPNTLSGVDTESVGAAASRARPAALNLAAIELNAAARNLALDWYGARFIQPSVECTRSVGHGVAALELPLVCGGRFRYTGRRQTFSE